MLNIKLWRQWLGEAIRRQLLRRAVYLRYLSALLFLIDVFVSALDIFGLASGSPRL